MQSIQHEALQSAAILAVKGRRGDTVWHVLDADASQVADHTSDNTIKLHSIDALDTVRSLEGLLARFNVGEIVFDPTGGFERALRLVSGAKSARGRLGRRLRSLHLRPDGRSLHARIADRADAPYVAAVLGETFARTLEGSGLELGMTVTTASPPSGALALERMGARQDDIARFGARASTALAIFGAAFAGLHAGTARANSPEPVAPGGRETESLPAARGVNFDAKVQLALADGIEPGPRARQARRPGPRPMIAAPTCPMGEGAPSMTSIVRAVYGANGALSALHLDNTDRGAGDEAFNQKAFALARSMSAADLAAPGVSPEMDGVRLLASKRVRAGRETAYVLTFGQCMAPPPPLPPLPPALPPSPPTPPPVEPQLAPPPAPVSQRGYLDLGVDYINRDVQEGAVGVLGAQLDLGDGFALNGQFAAGQIDSEFAGAAQAAIQRFTSLEGGNEMALGAFGSATQSAAPNGKDFDIYRAGLGAAFIGESVQLVVRGGYAQSEGFLERDGGFVRGEATWFLTPDLALDLIAEDDPITGTGAGVGAAIRPFTELFPQLMLDADANWHEDGEDSFRIGMRWMFGAEESRTVRERRARQGMAPTLQVELERLPDWGKNGGAASPSYCGEADCPAP